MPKDVKTDWTGRPFVDRGGILGRDYGSVEVVERSWGGFGGATKVSVPADGLSGVFGGRTTIDLRDQGDSSVSGADLGGYETGSSDHSTGEPSSCVADIIGCVVGLTILFILMIPVFSWARRMDEKMRTRRSMSYPYRNASSVDSKPKGNPPKTTPKGPHWRVEGSRIYRVGRDGQLTGESASVDEFVRHHDRKAPVRTEPVENSQTGDPNEVQDIYVQPPFGSLPPIKVKDAEIETETIDGVKVRTVTVNGVTLEVDGDGNAFRPQSRKKTVVKDHSSGRARTTWDYQNGRSKKVQTIEVNGVSIQVDEDGNAIRP